MSISDEYLFCSSIDNVDTRAIMDFLSLPESVNKMIIDSELRLSAITPIV